MRASVLKLALVFLLAGNAAYFILSGSTSKAIDSCAWLTLLVLFMIETSFGKYLTTAAMTRALRLLRLLAAAGVFAATAGYILEDNLLDAANSVLWILVVVLLELQLRASALNRRYRRRLASVAWALYGGLGLLVVLWAAGGLWFDAYDAILWIAAFVMIEVTVSAADSRRSA